MHIANIIQQQTGINLQKVSGSGAGGGIGGGLHALLNIDIERGIDLIFEISKFKDAIQWADVVITGEGKVDEQTWQGKVVSGVVAQAKAFSKHLIIVCGQQDLHLRETVDLSIYSLSSIFGTTRATEDTKATLTELVNKMQLIE